MFHNASLQHLSYEVVNLKGHLKNKPPLENEEGIYIIIAVSAK